MTELMKRYEAETGESSLDAFWDGKNSYPFKSRDYVDWLEKRLMKLERSIRCVFDLLDISDVTIPPAPEGE